MTWSSTPIAAPTFSTRPFASQSSWTVTRVSVSLSLWNVTTPAWSSSPPVEFQATRSSGCCSVMLASNVRSMPPILTFHSVSVSVTCVIDYT